MTKAPQFKVSEIPEHGVVDRLIAAVQDLSLADNLDAIAEVVRVTARALTGADGATFVLRDGGLCHYVDEDAIGPLWKGRRFPLDSCISGWVMQHRQAASIEDIYADPRIPVDAYRPTFVKSLVMVPIRTREPIGAIGNYWARRHRPSDDEIRALQALADATAVAMERVQLYRELEQRVRERTSELEAANRRLAVEMQERQEAEQTRQSSEAEARRMRLERDQLARVLASGIAHELTQPLSASNTYIDAAVRLLRRDAEASAEIIDAMESAAAQNRRAVDIVRKFRELLRRGEPDFQVIDLNEAIRTASAMMEEEARELGIAIGLDLDEALDRVRGDAGQIDHVLMNLLRNALEAMCEAAVMRGSLQVRTRPGRTGFVQVSVIDSGPGLSAEANKELFTPFHTTKDTGLGLGLSVSRNIVEAHGGELWAESNERSGAAFNFTLPVDRKPDDH